MKERTRLFLLKILSAIAAFSAAYSVIPAVRILLFKESGGAALFFLTLLFFAAGTGAGITGSAGGWLSGRISGSKPMGILLLYKSREEKERAVSSVLLYFSGIIPALLAIVLFQKQGFLKAGFEAIVILIVYLIATRCGLNSAYDNMTTRAAAFGLVVFLVSFGASSYYAPLMGLKPYVSIFAYLFLLAYLIIKNQEDIDYNIFSGRYVVKSVLPKEMRSYNLRAIIILFTVLLLLLNFHIITALLSQIGDWLLKGLRALFALLGSGEQSEQPIPEPQQERPAGFPFLGDAAEVMENPVVVYIRGVLITTIVLYLAYKLLTAIYRYVVKKLLPLLRELLKKFLRPGRKEQFESEGDYDDETEIEKPLNDRGARREARARVRKVRRELKGITDPVERVRCMYAAVLGMLQAGGIGITRSDTVGEVYGKAAGVKGVTDPLGKLSGGYEQVRYGSFVPESADLNGIEQSYTEITEQLLKKK